MCLQIYTFSGHKKGLPSSRVQSYCFIDTLLPRRSLACQVHQHREHGKQNERAGQEGIGFHLQKHVADDVSHGHQGAEEPGLGVAQDATEVEEEST